MSTASTGTPPAGIPGTPTGETLDTLGGIKRQMLATAAALDLLSAMTINGETLPDEELSALLAVLGDGLERRAGDLSDVMSGIGAAES